MGKLGKLLKRNWLVLAGGILGATVGYLYWRFVGCTSGSCQITSLPVMSTIYGSIFGGLLLSMFKPNKKQKN